MLSGYAGGVAAGAETSFSHRKVTFQLWVQVLTWDQELLGNLRRTPCDTQTSSENTTARGGTTVTAFQASTV